ncbi:hypothetical protein [Aquimarina agarilytica]|uniref:hypothetical protein n=1 Tax=Aquimarina agarilytica TaxID=1087449 RepID=UPI0002894E7A|nr:hypothetical protein [Aquimarina agarilytica]
MDKLYVNYIEIDMSNGKNQQAAGFPPFTRGYHTHNFSTQVTTKKLFTDSIHFRLSDFSVTQMTVLFNEIVLQKELHHKTTTINLKIPFTDAIDTIISIRTLRTVLACICDDLYKSPNTLKFNFIAFPEAINTIFNTHNLAKIAQVDTLVVNDRLYNTFIKIQSLLPKFPIDCLSGSKEIEEKTATLFLKVYSEFSSY